MLVFSQLQLGFRLRLEKNENRGNYYKGRNKYICVLCKGKSSQ